MRSANLAAQEDFVVALADRDRGINHNIRIRFIVFSFSVTKPCKCNRQRKTASFSVSCCAIRSVFRGFKWLFLMAAQG